MGKAWREINGRVQLVEVDGCSNCGATDGTFRIVDGKRFCVPKCARPDQSPDKAKNLWNFSTMNISDNPNHGPIEVKSLRHLRQLENQFGVASVVGNMSSKDWERK